MYKVIIVDSEDVLWPMSKTDCKNIALSMAVALKNQGFASGVLFPDGSIHTWK